MNETLKPPLQSEAASATDEALAMLLSRIAAQQGRAVPVHRFTMASLAQGGSEVMALSRELRAREWWISAFPEGEVREVTGRPTRDELPLLWVAADGSDACLVSGLLSHGGYVTQGSDGKTRERAAGELPEGTLLRLNVRRPDHGPDVMPHTAAGWFRHALRRRSGRFIEAVLATALMSVLALGASVYTMQVYDRVVPNQSYSTLIVLTVGTGLALLLELLMKLVRSHMVDRICKDIDEELSGVFFGRVLGIRMDARPKTIGTFASQIKQFELVRGFMTASTLFLMADAPFVLFFIAVIGMIGGAVALVPMALLPISLAVGFYARWRLMQPAQEQLKAVNHKNGVLIETIDGIEAIKAAGGEWKMQDRWGQLTREAAEHELAIRSAATAASNLAQSIQQASYVLMIGVGAYLVTTGSLTQGALIACSIISNRALGPIAQIPGLMVQWQHAREALRGLDEMMALPHDGEQRERRIVPTSCTGQLAMEGAAFAYNKDAPALRPVTLAIRPGERIAVLGSVGSGKSTLLKLLSGLYQPSEGRVFLDGVDMRHLAPEFVREQIGYLTQDVRLFQGTLRDNLILGLPSPSDEQLLVAARKTGLEQMVRAHPAGYALPIQEGGRGLSGGQRQVVGLTRLLIARPRVLLLDEPTASMDGDLEAQVMSNLFASLPKDTVIVMATHKRGLVQLVDRVIVLDRGRVVLDGPRDEIMARLQAGPRHLKPGMPVTAGGAQ